jgi:hypothetical protein
MHGAVRVLSRQREMSRLQSQREREREREMERERERGERRCQNRNPERETRHTLNVKTRTHTTQLDTPLGSNHDHYTQL